MVDDVVGASMAAFTGLLSVALYTNGADVGTVAVGSGLSDGSLSVRLERCPSFAWLVGFAMPKGYRTTSTWVEGK